MKLIAIFITNNVTAYGGVKPLRQVALFIFVPDGNGMRYQKSVNGTETEYYYNGDQLLMENRGGSIDRIYYIYDESGVAGILIGGSYYYFDKNMLGDVVAIRNEVGVIVAQYEYDAWGNHTVTDRYGNVNTNSTFIGISTLFVTVDIITIRKRGSITCKRDIMTRRFAVSSMRIIMSWLRCYLAFLGNSICIRIAEIIR